MKTTKDNMKNFHWPCMVCHKNKATSHGEIMIKRGPLQVYVCDKCATENSGKILEKLGFFDKDSRERMLTFCDKVENSVPEMRVTDEDDNEI